MEKLFQFDMELWKKLRISACDSGATAGEQMQEDTLFHDYDIVFSWKINK